MAKGRPILFYDPVCNGDNGFADTIEDVLAEMRKDYPDADGDQLHIHSDQIVGEPGCQLRIVSGHGNDPFILIARV